MIDIMEAELAEASEIKSDTVIFVIPEKANVDEAIPNYI